MQDLDSFISPIPDFEGDILILPILVSVQPPSGEVESDPFVRVSVGLLRTRAGKQKATTNPPSQKKGKKVEGKSSGGTKINEPAPKAHASTPPSGRRRGILIHRSSGHT
jgi:hypothetical protein